MHADQPRRVDACIYLLSGIFDNYDLTARDFADGGFFSRDFDAVQPIEFGGLLSLSSAITACGIVVKSDPHGGDFRICVSHLTDVSSLSWREELHNVEQRYCHTGGFV